MAENENQQERTEQPTARRIEQARERGQVPRSADLNAAVVVLAAGLALELFGGYGVGQMHALMRSGLALSRDQAMDESAALVSFSEAGVRALVACAPIWGLTILVAVVAPMALGGRRLAFQALAPDFTRLDPIAGFGRMFSVRGAVELAKAFAKFLLLGTVAIAVLWQRSHEIMALGSEPVPVAIAHAASLAGFALTMLALGLVAIAAIDVPWQLWQYTQQLRMSRAEVREEMRESEGAPEIKGRIRNLQRELAKRRMMRDVPKADVVVVNPTHYAVALRYDEQRMRAPIVIAKGQDLIAARIREIAEEHRVPIFEAPPLARALHRYVEIGSEIPTSLYVAVAQVLTYITQLRSAKHDGAAPPLRPSIEVAIDPDPEPSLH
jgi:flagellar biosynthetic protein FlhB